VTYPQFARIDDELRPPRKMIKKKKQSAVSAATSAFISVLIK